MDLSYEDVQNILKIIDASSLEELQLEIGDLKLVVRKRGAAATPDGAAAAPASLPADDRAATTPTAPSPSGLQRRQTTPVDGEVILRAPMVGRFYRAPKPGAAPFVEAGTSVGPDDVVCIIEVMKLMNSIPAGRAGRIREILVEDGQVVEYDQPLLVIEPRA